MPMGLIKSLRVTGYVTENSSMRFGENQQLFIEKHKENP